MGKGDDDEQPLRRIWARPGLDPARCLTTAASRAGCHRIPLLKTTTPEPLSRDTVSDSLASPRSNSRSLWHPLRTPTFRNLIIADVISDVGTFMQSVGAAWLMVSLGAGPMFVALTQTASSLPFFVLALPAGAAGDIFDRRKLILWTEAWMVSVAVALAVLTLGGLMSPWLLLVLTFGLSAGDALETPTWRAILPELVGKDDLVAASALNGIEFNLARAVGPALAGLLIAGYGVATAFVVNVASFVGVIVVVARWNRPIRKRTSPAETVAGATVAAVRFVRYSPAIRAVMFRSGAVMFFASALLALLPTAAHRVSASAIGYGLLLGCFGAGAVLGALLLQRARARWSTEVVASAGVVIVGVAMVGTSAIHRLAPLGAVMLGGGAGWIVFMSLVSALIQSLAPDWVRARVLAVFMLVSQGSLALGSAVWGAVGERAGIETALLLAGAGAIATTVLALVSRLPDATGDVSPWNHWRLPAILAGVEPGLDEGPVLITVEYLVDPARTAAFIEAMHEYGRVRRRDGASRWGIYHDTEVADRYVEAFLVSSWAEHLRQHERQTLADRALEDRLHACVRGVPRVHHLIYAALPD
jgi:predicted MFS family arabinose efflux permease